MCLQVEGGTHRASWCLLCAWPPLQLPAAQAQGRRAQGPCERWSPLSLLPDATRDTEMSLERRRPFPVAELYFHLAA